MVTRSAVENIATRASQQRQHLITEEATKHALVLPMLQALGYDVFNPEEIVPEFTADFGIKQGEKVDYAIIRDGSPAILIECKKLGDPLDRERASQLARYFAVTSARIGVLTDGVMYKFFSDLDADNVMDEDPFMEIDVTSANPRDLQALNHFARHSFDLEEARTAASNMKHIAGMKDYLTQMHTQPDEDFVRLLARRVFTGPLFHARVEHFTGIARLAFHEFVNDLINDTLRRASNIVNSGTVEDPEPLPVLDGDGNEDTAETKGIVTTAEEIQGYELVKTIVSDVVDPERVFIRDTKSYCGVLLDDTNRKPICRMHFNTSRKRLPILAGERSEDGTLLSTFYDIEDVNDIAQYAEKLRAAARARNGAAGEDE